MKVRPLEECLELNDSGTWGEEGDATDYPVLRSSNIQDGRLVLEDIAHRKVPPISVDKYRLRDGDIIVTKSSGSPQLIGKSCLFISPDNQTYLFSNFTQRLRAKRGTLDPHYLYFFLNSSTAKAYLNKISNTTSGLRNLNMKDYARQLVPIPPVQVQQRIAAILAKADAAREKRRQENKLAEQFLQSAFFEMFGDPVTNPKGWKQKSLSGLLTFLTSGSRGWAKYYSSTGNLFLRIENVARNELLLENLTFVTPPSSAEAKRIKAQSATSF